MRKNLNQKIEDVIFTIFDTETTGDNVRRTDKPIEIAAIHWNLKKGFIGMPKSWLVNPLMPIHPAAIAVHGLTDEDVENSPLLEDVLPELHQYIKDTVLVAHNIEFDLNMLPSFKELENAKIDSLRFVRHIFKIGEPGYKMQELSSHKMQELRYWLNLKVDTMGLQAHRAAADILVTGEVFCETLKRFLDTSFIDNLHDMLDFIESPILVEKMNFGKYKNVSIYEAVAKEKDKSKNYFGWLLKAVNKGDMTIDDDLKYSIEFFLKQHDIDPLGLLLEEKQKNWKGIAHSFQDNKNVQESSIKNNVPSSTEKINTKVNIDLAIKMLSQKGKKKH